MNKKLFDYFYTSCTIIWNIFLLILGIAELIFIFRYEQIFKELDNGCDRLWKSLGLSILNVYQSVIFIMFCIIFLAEGIKINKYIGCLLLYCFVTQYIVSISVTLAYNDTSEFCYNFWIRNVPELWTFAVIECFNLWITIFISLLSVCKFMIWLCSPMPSAMNSMI